MKIILTTLNSKYIHSNLAIRYLKEYIYNIDDIDIALEEFTINQNIDFILSEVFKKKPDLVCFSTYIWNLNQTLELCNKLKIVNPNIKILLGGPEVSFDGEKYLKEYSFIDYVIYGEGEETFRELILSLKENKDKKNIKGLIYRNKFGDVIKNNPRPLLKDLNIIPSPYRKLGDELKNKIVYYESSRGCPFNCAFCLSSTIKGVRYFDIERVKKDLDNLINANVRQVKFVDRTFNANKEYAKEIMSFIMEKNPKNINFHFEVTAHLLDEDMLRFLSKAKEGLFQFEIGVQSTNKKTIQAIKRTTDFAKLAYVSKTIKSNKNIHQHLDLIAGLPYEDYKSFEKSFNDVFDLRPEKIQLGFLKLLKGSKLREEEKKHGYKYYNLPPYEVLESKYIKYKELIRLKYIEDMVEKFYNEGYFKNTIEFIIRNYYSSSFKFFEDLSVYWVDKDYHKYSHSRKKLYIILKEFAKYNLYKDYIYIENLIKYDYIFNHSKTRIPNILNLSEKVDYKFNIHELLKNKYILDKYLFKYKDLPTKKLINKTTVEYFNINILKLIENNYNIDDMLKEDTYILFKHKDGIIERCDSFDITEIVEELTFK